GTGPADELDRWHAGGRAGPRPPGRLRPHRPERLPWRTRLWALPAYRLVYDPDGRPLRARRAGTW
ncbi:phospholipase, partial [Micromonospora aurantiaca]|nr:phospholipase [Micromonospora aurantiaca]